MADLESKFDALSDQVGGLTDAVKMILQQLGMMSETTTVAPGINTQANEKEMMLPPEQCVDLHRVFEEKLFEGPDYLDYEEIENDRFPQRYAELGVTAHFLNVTTINWMTPNDTTIYTWWHRVVVFIPDNYDNNIQQHLYFRNFEGRNRKADDLENLTAEEIDAEFDFGHFAFEMENLAETASKAGTIAAVQFDSPAEAMQFKFDPTLKIRTEDEMAAFSWVYYLKSVMAGANKLDIDVIMQVPTAKSTIKTFNAIRDFVLETEDITLTKYSISGVSKRGQNAWTVAAFDDRVMAVMPVVYNFLNVDEYLNEHFRQFGAWSFALYPYFVEGLPVFKDAPEFQNLLCIADPYRYLYKYANRNLPILNTGTTGDQFMLVQSSDAYLPAFREKTDNNIYRRTIHNLTHYVQYPDLMGPLGNQKDEHYTNRLFYVNAAYDNLGDDFPQVLNYSTANNGTHGFMEVTVRNNLGVSLQDLDVYIADTNNDIDPTGGLRRDFRSFHLFNGVPNTPTGVFWYNAENFNEQVDIEELESTGTTASYKVVVPFRPDAGFRAFYVDFTLLVNQAGAFAEDQDRYLNLSTPPYVIPDQVNFEPCYGMDCVAGGAAMLV